MGGAEDKSRALSDKDQAAFYKKYPAAEDVGGGATPAAGQAPSFPTAPTHDPASAVMKQQGGNLLPDALRPGSVAARAAAWPQAQLAAPVTSAVNVASLYPNLSGAALNPPYAVASPPLSPTATYTAAPPLSRQYSSELAGRSLLTSPPPYDTTVSEFDPLTKAGAGQNTSGNAATPAEIAKENLAMRMQNTTYQGTRGSAGRTVPTRQMSTDVNDGIRVTPIPLSQAEADRRNSQVNADEVLARALALREDNRDTRPMDLDGDESGWDDRDSPFGDQDVRSPSPSVPGGYRSGGGGGKPVTTYRNPGRGNRPGGSAGTSPRFKQGTIYFYESNRPHYGFTNFSSHEVKYQGKPYPTSEHLFQAFKFLEHRPGLAEHIRTAGKGPRSAFNEAHRFAPETRTDWYDVNIKVMEEVILHKFEQHADLRRELLMTGDAELVENAGANDAFWGNGADGKGRNELGKALMRLRDHFKGQTGRR